jgi:hypothetical protein
VVVAAPETTRAFYFSFINQYRTASVFRSSNGRTATGSAGTQNQHISLYQSAQMIQLRCHDLGLHLNP